jgi:hypothetical protein
MPNFTVPDLRSVLVGQVQEIGVKAKPVSVAAEDFKKILRLTIQCCLWKFLLIVQPF